MWWQQDQDGYRVVTVHTHVDFISAAPPGDQADSTMTGYPIQSHYHAFEPTSRCPILIMQSAWLGSDKNKYLSYRFVSTRIQTCDLESYDLPKWEMAI